MTPRKSRIAAKPGEVSLPKAWAKLRYHAGQHRLYNCPARFVAVAAGRRSGKTEIAKRRLVRALAETRYTPDGFRIADPRYFFGCPTERQAKRVAWNHLLDLTPDAWIAGGKHGRNVSHSELWFRTIFGSYLFLIGFDQPARFEGSPWDGGVLDESSDHKPGVFDRTVRPALSDRGGWCWRIGVPKRNGPASPEFRQFFEACESGDYQNGEGFAWPSSDILPPEELAQARATMDAKDYAEQYEASWQTAGGQAFHAFSREYNVRPCQYVPTKPLVIGSDFNVDPLAWVIGHRYPNHLEWIDEIWLRNASTMGALEVLWQRYHDHRGGFEFYGDATSSGRRTSAFATDYQQIDADPRFRQAGRSLHYPPSNPPVVDRIAATNAMLCNANEDRRMFVSPSCRHLIDDFENRHYKPYERKLEDKKDLGHITDACGYVVWRVYPYGQSAQQPTRVIARR